MHRAIRHTTLFGSLAAVVSLVALLITSSAGVAANPPAPGYKVVFAPATVSGGATTSITATITSELKHGQIDSAELFPPASLTVTAASVPAPLPAAVITTCTVGTPTGPCVQLSKLALASGKSVVVTLSVAAPPSCSTVVGTWGTVANVKDEGEDVDSGPNDTDDRLTLDATNSALTTSAVDSCHFVFATAPHSIIENQPITGVDYNPAPASGSPTVDVLDAANLLVTTSTDPVAVAIGSNPGSSTLSGTTTVNAVGGVATLAGLSLNNAGNAYTLTVASPTAAVPQIAGATSAFFNVAATGTSCPTGGATCNTQATGTGGKGVVVATPSTSGSTGVLVESANPPGDNPLACTGYTTSDPNTYEFVTTSADFSKTITITITSPIGVPKYDPRDTDGFRRQGGDGDNDYDDVLWHQQLCLQAPYTFTTLAGTPLTQGTLADGTVVYTGLLPNCPASGTPTAPCHNRSLDKVVPDSTSSVGYDIVLSGFLPSGVSGDPRMN